MLSIQTDAQWTKCAGAAELWRVDKAEEDEPTFNAQLTRTENTMSTLAKQERTICVLLPNKDQLDIAVGVSVYMWASLICPHYGEWHFGCTTLSLDWFVMQISFFVFVHLLAAQIHWARCLQPCGWASGNQRTALLWPHNGKRWVDGFVAPPQPLILWAQVTISLEMSTSPHLLCDLTARSTSALLFLLLFRFFFFFFSSLPQHIETPQWSFVAPHLNKQPFVFCRCRSGNHIGLHSCNINFIKPGMQPCIPHPFQGEGWMDDGKRRVGVNNARGELGDLLIMTQAVLLSSHS